MTKPEIRQQMLSTRRELDAETKAFHDMLVFERAHKQRVFQRAERVHVFRSTAEEIDTMKFIEYAWGTGKDVFVPVVDRATTTLLHVKVTYDTAWRESAYGIHEPVDYMPSDLADATSFGPSSVIIVPLLAFDVQCHRLGYGKGFYDAFLRDVTAPTIGLAYEFQRVRSLPVESHDVALSCVATEQRLYIPA
ncbi:MAG: 5-formyltetrahydrofolate cyclo-ligase [Candidatus Kapabacteria bacterium]|nr:5-formyltetrahydrofolate cyclo-ligase [Candidatus Kapabacteria bacterium]